ncbi:hypothetical protein YDYSY3_60510 [Paenibacillus chitinolyticus]|uniref:hypothetical protein n=1 Tax=Paenibacillus chitinolyticus TaxID=79263 RepID=UPI0026E4FD8F|nr:hypothetical protein [Paenibacillus chitinolyticus]GKS15051.1 hypothetical protein YDYSY3_60510 [Paenibacillus chitinolyticus]
MINKTQIIPATRFLFAKHVEIKELRLTQQQKAFILRAITGGVLLGPIGAIVGV